VDLLVGNATKARQVLGWETQYSFQEMIREMVETDMKLAQAEARAAAIRSDGERSEAAGRRA
jgi:UDP-glucose 4-epimerase